MCFYLWKWSFIKHACLSFTVPLFTLNCNYNELCTLAEGEGWVGRGSAVQRDVSRRHCFLLPASDLVTFYSDLSCPGRHWDWDKLTLSRHLCVLDCMFKRISFSLHDVIFMRIMFVCMFMCAYRLHAVFHVIYADTFSTGKAVSTKSTPVLHVTVVPFQWKIKIE